MKKRILAFLCILSLVMTNVMPVYASNPVDSKVETAAEAEVDTEENKTISESFTFVNPVYADQITEEELEKELSEIQKEEKKSSSKTRNTEYISDLNVLAEMVREKMERRESSISINYKGSSYDGVPKEIVYMAMEETGVPTEGDYLLFHYGGYKCGISGTVENDTYYVTFNYTMSYYTTWEQEEAVTETVEKVLTELGIKSNGQIVTSMSDYEKVCKIYDYICSNVTYDHKNLNDKTYTLKAAAYAALIHKTAVCQGYANLFYRMAKEAGVDARIISGTSRGEGHAWNIVKLDGTYYNLDSTWDAGRSEYDYFLKGTKDFDEVNTVNDHTPDPEYLAEEFTSAYPISDTVYVLDEKKEPEDEITPPAEEPGGCEEHVFAGWQMTPATMGESGEKTNECVECGYTEYEEIPQIDTVTLSGTSYTYTGKAITTPKVTVKDIEGNKLTLNKDYKVAYSNNVNAGKAAVKVTFMGDYAGNPVTKTFTIKPVAVAKLKISLAAAAYTYNGAARKPAVTVKNASNVKLVSGKDYTVAYAAGRKNVGKYAVKITCKGNYSGTKTLYFTINPKGTTIKSLTKGAKRFTVKWNKVTTQTTGYQIRYSRNSSMSGAKTVTVKNNKTTSATVKNLVAKKKYFVQVRTYKNVNGTKYYSGWSAKKNVTVK